MTEAEWLACDDPMELFGRRPVGGERKLRLFACACCLCGPSIAANRDYCSALQVSEDFADGLASEDELREVHTPIRSRAHELHEHTTDEPAYRRWAECTAVACATALPTVDAFEAAWMVHRAAEGDTSKQLVARVRDIFGNPFRRPLTDSTLPPVAHNAEWRWLWFPLAFVSEWRTDATLAIARDIYAERAFDRLPVLADALQDAGCNNDSILEHCRDASAVHVRGCWVVDLVLGKA